MTHSIPLRTHAPDDVVRLVLCMIVRNESKVIDRCLASALPHVDGVVVCDTGSTDDTIDRVREGGIRAKVPWTVVQHEWVNFGWNRTLAAGAAQRWVEEQEWRLDRTYLLLLDADMVLHVAPGFDRQALRATSYDVKQDDGVIRYSNTRLLCLETEWEAVGPTHEYWRPRAENVTTGSLDLLAIEDRADGGNRSSKYERDIELLRDALRVEPENPRYIFYLAQSYFDTGRWAEAADWYMRRWRLGGWDEERWYSRYRTGLCLLEMEEWERGAGVLLEAFDERPTRAEPLWALARHYRERGMHHVALPLVLRGLETGYPEEDVLFVERQVYEWRLWEELMISAWYAGPRYLPLGLEACDRLLSREGHDPAFYEYVTGNRAFYRPHAEQTPGAGADESFRPDDRHHP